MNSISTQHGVVFQVYLLNHRSLSHEIWSTNRYSHKQFFREYNANPFYFISF